MTTGFMHRRSVLTLLGSAAAVWPLAARAQQDGRLRRVSALISGSQEDPLYRERVTAFQSELARLGWIDSQNLRLDLRFAAANIGLIRSQVAALMRPDTEAMVVTSTPAARAALQQSRSIPILFTSLNDPVSSGVVANVSRPEGNITGFANYEPSMGGKWLALLKEAAPHITRVAPIFDPDNSPETYLPSIESSARALGVQTVKVPVRTPFEIVRAIDRFAMEPNGGLLAFPDVTISTHRQTVYQIALEHRLPAMFQNRFASEGALLSYSSDPLRGYRGVASYIDRILRGAKVSELPVQFPAKFDLAVNLKTAKAIGLEIPEAFLLRADEVIE